VSTTRLARLFVGAIIFVLAGSGIASAQTAPASGTTVAQTTTPPKKKDPPRPPWLILHVIPQWKYMLGTSDLPRPNSVCSGGTCGQAGNYIYEQGQTRLGYGAVLNLGRGVSFNYTHSYVDQTIGRVTNVHNEFVYQQWNDDRVDDANLAYAIPNIATSVAIGWHSRIRQCCGNGAGEEDKNEWESYYFRITGRLLGPTSRYFGKLIGLTGQADWIPHDNQTVCSNLPASTYKNMGCASGNAYFSSPYCTKKPSSLCFLPQNGAIPNAGNLVHGTGTFNITYPVGGPESPFAVFGTYFNDWDYYLNSPIPYLYNREDFGFIWKYKSWVTITAADSNLYQHIGASFPYVFPNVVNRNRLDLSVDLSYPVSNI
jgi:hypothetical protein